MKKNKRILISLLLVIVMLTLTSSPVLSADVKEEPTAVTEQVGASITSDAVSSDVKEEVVALNVYSLDKSECMIAEYVNTEEFNKASHVKRLNDEEELDTYVFLNADGTKSVYYMDENVKFIDKNGDVKEKDVSLVKKTDGFGIVRNEFDLHIPNAASSGISMSYNGYDVKLIPQTSVRAVPARQNGDTVVYDGFFGTNTSLVYTPMLSGVKEDVVMKAYIPNAEFRFVLETDGLGLYLGKDGYYLAESEDGEAVLSLGNVIIYDAIGKPDYGTMTVTTVTANQKYILSLSAPEEFLTDPTTVYPVTIDPTLTVSDTATGDGAIEDTVLFSGRPSKNYGDYKYLSIGYVDSTYGVGRVAVKLPGLYNSAEYLNTHYSDITSVKFYCRDSSGNSAQYVNLHPITGPLWDENTITYGDSVTYSTTYNWGTSMSSGTWTSFDITVLVQAWKNIAYAPTRGFILINSNETSASYKKAPYSSEYTGTALRPYVMMTYNGPPIISGTYIIENAKTEKYVDIENQTMANGTIIHQWDYHSGSTQRWLISYAGDGFYTIRSAHNSNYYLAVQNDSSGDAAIVLKSGTITDGMKWKVTKTSGNKYKISSKSGNANNKALSLSSDSSTANGNDIVQRTYTNNTNYEDEWVLYCISSMPTANLQLIYDNAYLTRYSDAYQRIINHASALQGIYMKRFGIWVNYSLPTSFTSYADANCYPNPDKACDHATDARCFSSVMRTGGSITLENLHHKNYKNIWLRIPLPDVSETLKVSFVGHRCCDVTRSNDNDGDGITDFISHDNGPAGAAYSGSGTCIITNFNSNASERKTFLHEFGHLYGAPDHYGGDTPTTDEKNAQLSENIFSKYCIYGEKREDTGVLENLTICEGCQQAILDNINRYNHN